MEVGARFVPQRTHEREHIICRLDEGPGNMAVNLRIGELARLPTAVTVGYHELIINLPDGFGSTHTALDVRIVQQAPKAVKKIRKPHWTSWPKPVSSRLTIELT